VRIDVESHRAYLGEEELSLTAKEFDLLRVLVRDAGRVITREQLMREVWDTTWWSSTKTLDMHISWLRKKLGDDATTRGSSPPCAGSASASSATDARTTEGWHEPDARHD
jgi:DNA-binding response OmpR family regulator